MPSHGRGGGGGATARPRIPAPDQEAFKRDVAALDGRIQKLLGDLKVIEQTQRAHARTLRSADAARRQRQAALRPRVAALKAMRARRAEAVAALAAKTREIAAVRSKSAATIAKLSSGSGANSAGAGDGGDQRNQRGRIQQRIRALERQQQTENMSLAAEKALVKDLGALRGALQETAGLDRLYAQRRELQAAVRAVEAQLREQQRALDAARATADTVGGGAGADGGGPGAGGPGAGGTAASAAELQAMRAQKPVLEQAYRAMRQSIDEAYAQKKALYDAHWTAKRDHRKLLDEWYEEQRAAKRLDEARRRAEEERLREEERVVVEAQKPWLEEIALCDLLIHFCHCAAPPGTRTTVAAAAAAIAAPPAATTTATSSSSVAAGSIEDTNVADGTDGTKTNGNADAAEAAAADAAAMAAAVAVVDTEGLGEMLSRKAPANRYAKKNKRAARVRSNNAAGKADARKHNAKKKKAGRVTRVVNTPDSLAGFLKLGVAAPTTSAALPTTIAALRRARAYWDTLPRHPQDAKAEPALAEMDSDDNGNDGGQSAKPKQPPPV